MIKNFCLLFILFFVMFFVFLFRFLRTQSKIIYSILVCLSNKDKTLNFINVYNSLSRPFGSGVYGFLRWLYYTNYIVIESENVADTQLSIIVKSKINSIK